jgi:hypothetical protein
MSLNPLKQANADIVIHSFDEDQSLNINFVSYIFKFVL